MSRPAIFLDRDGTLMEDTGYVRRPGQVRLLPGVGEALRRLAGAGFALVVCTNQSGLARGILTDADLVRVEQELLGLLAREGVRLEAVYHCPHHPEGPVEAYRRRCACRKPGPGLLRRAAAELSLDPEASWVVGDSIRDVEAGARLGTPGVLLADPDDGPSPDELPAGCRVVPDLATAAERILGEREGGAEAASDGPADGAPDRVLVFLPTWIGDTVMATPLLRALRRAWVGAEIAVCGRPVNLRLLEETGFCDRTIPDGSPDRLGPRALARRVGDGWDAALLLPNSLRVALTARAAGIPRRVGYADRFGRGLLLTDALEVDEDALAFGIRPVPMARYYLALGGVMGVAPDGPHLELPADEETEGRAREWLAERDLIDRPFLGVTPGAAFGPSKLWMPGRVATVCDRLRRTRGLRTLFLGGPGDREICREIAGRMTGDPVGDPAEVTPIEMLRPIFSHATLQLTADAGGRYFGQAAGIPVVCVIGPTHPGYTRTTYPLLRVVREHVPCWPCHLKECPFDHECMRRVTVDRVVEEAEAVLEVAGARAA